MEEDVKSGQVDLAILGDVASHKWQDPFVDIEKTIDATLPNPEPGQLRDEVIADEEAEEDKIIDDPFEVVLEWKPTVHELVVQIFSVHTQFYELKLDGEVLLGQVIFFLRWTCVLGESIELVLQGLELVRWNDQLPEDVEVWLVSREPEEEQVGISTIDAMSGVGVVILTGSLLSEELQDLVFSFTRNARVTEDALQVLEGGVGVESDFDVQLDDR